jgi:hypothetical protein
LDADHPENGVLIPCRSTGNAPVRCWSIDSKGPETAGTLDARAGMELSSPEPKLSSDVQEPKASQKVVAQTEMGSRAMNSIIYLVGLIVVVLAILSFFGLA